MGHEKVNGASIERFFQKIQQKNHNLIFVDQHKPKQLQSVIFYIFYVLISISLLLSHNFLVSHVATCAVYSLLIACHQN